MKNITEENYNLYEKAVKRLKNCGITDPTNVIAELEKEIDSYRVKIRCHEEEFRKIRKETYIKDALGKIVHNPGMITEESEEYLFVTTSYGITKYSKLKLAIFWLEHSNDCFYETFGFNWIPDNKTERKAKNILNESHAQAIDKIFKINIDFIDSLLYATENMTHKGN